ncbi:MAG TPA: YjbF family lipoprotein [Rhizomicrobium sp.]|nr:YjbF family lipoprotein [Rhizomicrobium sp.]
MTRKARPTLLFAALALCLFGCDTATLSITDTDIGKLGVLLYNRIVGSSASVPRERAAAIPYATLGVRLGGSDQSMFVLASGSGTDLLWLGGKSVALSTRHGRVVRTVGFPHNISGVHAAEGVRQDFTQRSVDYLYDFAEESRYGIPVRCVRQNLGSERIVIIGVPHDANHLAEDCNASGLDWSFRNEFWVDTAGFVWKSRQFVHPKLDPLELEVLRPAAE